MGDLISPVLYDEFEPDMFQSVVETTQENERVEPEEKLPPEDRQGVVKIIFYFLGVTILLPWVFFVTCNDYWMYRFRNLNNHTANGYSELQNFSFLGHLNRYFFQLFSLKDETGRTSLQTDFTAYLSIAATVPNTIILFVNMFYLRRFSTHWRIMISNAFVIFLFGITTILVLFDCDGWQNLFFIITMVTVVILNGASAILQAALCALFMKFPKSYISAFSSGLSLSGIFAAVAQILVLLTQASLEKSTFFYFIFADITIFIAFIGYIYMRDTEFYKYYAENDLSDNRSFEYQRLGSTANLSRIHVSYSSVSKKTWIFNTSMFFCYLVTCSVYPSLVVLICSQYREKSEWGKEFFVPVVTYLLYYTFEYIGRILAGIIERPRGIMLVWFTIIRVVFIPLFMFCNAQPRHHLPVLIGTDWIYALFLIALALSNGYITTLTLISIPETVQPHEQEVASTMLVIWLAFGLLFGSGLSFPLIDML